MDSQLGTAHLNDDEFITAFERCEISGGCFHHADHLRLARLYLQRFGPAGAAAPMLAGIRRMADSLRAPQKFHYTATIAWLRLVAASIQSDPAGGPFEHWMAAHRALLDRDALLRHYSKHRLDSEAARQSWLEPDLEPLP